MSIGFALVPSRADAEADLFGTGDGHSGAKTAAAAAEVINAYAPLTADAAAGATTLAIGTPLGAAGGFATGDLVLVWRATGLAEADAPSGDPARIDLNVKSGGAVGRFEFARVGAAAGGSLTLTKPLVSDFAKDVTQVVKVPEYTTVSVPGGTSLSPLAWQAAGSGFAGGILVFLAQQSVDVAGKLDANEKGFRGGASIKRLGNALIANCPNMDGTPDNGYAPKGEGVVSTQFGATIGGRGNRAIGAGGGNCAENGGAGGGNFGHGGPGGTSTLDAVASNGGGIGGSPLDYSLLSRVSLGGGGGAGEQKNGAGSGGGNGGGAIFFRARTLSGAGTIEANGQTAANATLINTGLESDGAGGGGAGGSVVIRLVDVANCGGIQAKGGNGGDSQVVGLSAWGPGGGGAGGRVLLQSKAGGTCTPVVDAGVGGKSGGLGRNAGPTSATDPTAIGQFEPLPAPGGNYCFSNTDPVAECTAGSPVCDPTTGFCQKCNGGFGSGATLACTVDVDPVCLGDGTCKPCNGDLGNAGTTQDCQVASLPYCFLTGAKAGSCGKCTTNADCTGSSHPGPNCSPTAGACGTPCTKDSDCKSSEWCDGDQVCIPKTPNGQHVPDVPPVNGDCTPETGTRTCISGVCEPDDDLCGKKNGDPCDPGKNEQCRDNICFTDDKCAKPDGQPCTGSSDCRSDQCINGVCAGCDSDDDCQIGQVCDDKTRQCIVGCRVTDAGASNCPPGQECSKKDGTVGQCQPIPDAGADSGDNDGGDAGPVVDTSGVVEGGGCACRTDGGGPASPLAVGGAAAIALLAMLRRKRSENEKRKRS
jgi:MYXO-CTERM domain-containing protein